MPVQDLPRTLGPSWDVGRDLAVLVGRGTRDMAGALASAGQQRLIVFLPEEGAERYPEPCAIVRTPVELMEAILALPGVLPQRVDVRRAADPWASDERLRSLARTIEKAIRTKELHLRTVQKQGEMWLRQGLENLSWIARTPSVAVLDGAFRGHPCIIVSPGPSLSKNIHLLEEARGRALLLAGTHSLGAMQKVGVSPHLLMAADAGDLDWHFDAAQLDPIDAFVLGATCHPQNWRRPIRRRFVFASNAQIDDWIFEGLEEDARIPTGGSVACSSLGLALRMGCDPIVLVGQDLSFTDGRFYAAETLDGNARVKRLGETGFYLEKPSDARGPGVPEEDGMRFTADQKVIEVPGYHGGTVPTSESFHSFLNWFEAVAESQVDGPRLFNCTEGGARIHGMEQATLREVLSGWTQELPAVGERLDFACESLDLAARGARVRAQVEAMLAAVDPCLDLAARCKKLAQRASRDQNKLDQLGRLEKRLSSALRPLRLLSLLDQAEIVAAKEQARTATTLDQNLGAARRLFHLVEAAARKLREPLARAARSL